VTFSERRLRMLTLRKAFAALSFLLFLGGIALADSPESPPQTPSVKIEQKSHSAAKDQDNAQTQTKAVEPITPIENNNAAADAKRHADDEAEKRAQEASEYGVFFGRRLKITDALLTLFTLFLVAVGIGQGIFLYRTDQGTHKAAEAAQKAAEVAEKSLTSTERAFVFLKYAYASPVFGPENKIAGWDIHIVWENAGPTPTQHMKTYKNLLHFPNGMPDQFDFPDLVRGDGPKNLNATFIGPKTIVDAGGLYVPLPVLSAVAAGHGKMFGWGWTEYGDVFRKGVRSRSEFCFEVVIAGAVDQPPTADIKPPFEFVSCGRHVGTEDECYRQPGQEIPILRLP
jgi:hypothetical protein